MSDVLSGDLDAAFERTRQVWAELDGSRILITGATGFVGTHLLESVAHARRRGGIDTRVVALVRNPTVLHERLPWTSQADWLELITGDVTEFLAPSGSLDLIVHAANTATASLVRADATAVARTVVEGSRHVAAVGASAGARRILQLSSGSVSGSHFTPAAPISEHDPGEPLGDAAATVLARAKREADLELCARAAPPAAVIARGFAFCGPWLPLDHDFAFGNFLRDGLAGQSIRVAGDGRPVRSYLYSEDLIVWLWTLLLRGAPGRAYNVGSEKAVSIGELAARIGAAFGVAVDGPVPAAAGDVVGTGARAGAGAHWHVPSTARARTELGLAETVSLDEAIARSARWWRARGF